VFLFAIMGLKLKIEKVNWEPKEKEFKSGKITKLQKFIENIFLSSQKENSELYENYQSIGKFDKSSNIILKPSEAKIIHKKFEILYCTRMNKKKSKHSGQNYKFKPKINSNAKRLAQKHRNKMFRQSEDVIKKSLELNQT